MSEIDWSRWLPPAALPDQGKLPWRVGQVWAWRSPRNMSDPIVYRVWSVDNGWSAGVEVLSRPLYPDNATCWMSSGGGSTGGCAVLVADVGCPPVHPSRLYGVADPDQDGLLLAGFVGAVQTLLEE